jgi:hypothetical protein
MLYQSSKRLLKELHQLKFTNRRLYIWIFMWIGYTATLLWGLGGRATGNIDGEVLQHYALFFTYQSAWIMWIGFTAQIAYKIFNVKKLSFTTNSSFRGAIVSYYTLTFIIACFLIGPLMASGQWGNASSSVTKMMENQTALWNGQVGNIPEHMMGRDYSWALLNTANPDCPAIG